MPVSKPYRDSHPKGAAQYEAWKRQAIRTAEAAGARVIDMERSMPDSEFSDFVHLTTDAANTWSAELSRELSSLECGEARR